MVCSGSPVTGAGKNGMRQAGRGLQHGEVRARDRRAGILIDLDRDIGRHVFCAWRAVVVDDHHVTEHFRDGGLAADRAAAASEGGLGQQGAEAREVAVVDEFGIGRDEVLDGLAVGRRIGRGGAQPW